MSYYNYRKTATRGDRTGAYRSKYGSQYREQYDEYLESRDAWRPENMQHCMTYNEYVERVIFGGNR